MIPPDLPPPHRLWLPPKPALVRAARCQDLQLVRQARREHQATFPFPVFVPAAAAAAAPATATFIASASSTADQTAYTDSVNLGSSGQYSHIFVGVTARAATTATLSSLTVAGNAAAQRVAHSNANNNAEIWSLAYSAGGTQNIVVTWSDTMVRQGIAVWGVLNLSSQTPTDTATDSTDPVSAAIDIAAAGFVLIMAGTTGPTSATAVGSGISEDADFVIADTSNYTCWAGSGNFASVQSGLTVGCDFDSSGTNPLMCAAAFR